MSSKLKYKPSPLNLFSLFLICYSIYFYFENEDMFGIRDLSIILLIITSTSCFLLNLFLQKITPKYTQLFIIELVIIVFLVFTFLVSTGFFSKTTEVDDSKDLIIEVK